MKRTYWTTLLSLLVITSVSRGDIVHLKNGGKIEGQIHDLGREVRIDFSSGSTTIRKSDIDHIEAKLTPEVEFANRLKQASDDPAACLELAQWAYQKNLNREYVLALRTALQLDGTLKEARRLLNEFEYQHAHLPAHPAAEKKLLAEAGPDFELWTTGHYRIAFQAAAPCVELCAGLLEQVYDEFGRFFRSRLFELAPLTDRVEVVLFDNRRSYDDYLKSHMPEMTGSSGFFSLKTNRSYFYDTLNDDRFLQAKAQLLRSQKQLAQQRRQIAESQDGSYIVTDPQGHQQTMTRAELLADMQTREEDITRQIEGLKQHYLESNFSISVHEAVHQLAYHCGIHSRYSENPKWIVEGLATYFEAPAGGWWQGAGRINPHRLKFFLDPMNRPLYLADLITDDELFNLSGTTADMAYASTWALFYYLAWQQHEPLFDYIYTLSLRNTLAAYPADQRLKDFEAHFGPIDALEVQWRRMMRTLAEAPNP